MEKEFWIQAWEEGRTGFNQAEAHPALEKYLPQFGLNKDTKTLVPLCGKSVDLLYLAKLGFNVHGVEFYEQAVSEFFAENNLPSPKIDESGKFKTFSIPRITLSVGDFFQLPSEPEYDFIYDRAALVALPQNMRPQYAQHLGQMLKPEGHILMVAYDYDQSEMEGPPFSVTEDEIKQLFPAFAIDFLGTITQDPESRLSKLSSLRECVFALVKE
jgi:thiopurine S-methyltransferase